MYNQNIKTDLMKYIKFPSINLNEIPQEVLDELHLVPRKSVDGT